MPHGFKSVGNELFLLQLLKEGVNKAGADVFADDFFEFADDFVAVDGPFVEYGKYVDAAEVGNDFIEFGG
jgi:hypothetical protein